MIQEKELNFHKNVFHYLFSPKNTIHTVSISLVKETDESDHSFLPSNTHP